jgi:hypothetical protein
MRKEARSKRERSGFRLLLARRLSASFDKSNRVSNMPNTLKPTPGQLAAENDPNRRTGEPDREKAHLIDRLLGRCL